MRSVVFCLALLLSLCFSSSAVRAEIDLSPVFSPVIPEEISLILEDWSSRPTEATQFTHERIAEVNGFTATRASFYYEGYKQYGLVRYPLHFSEDGSFPVLVLHHGGEQGFYYLDGINFDQEYPTGCIADSSFVIVPTYRGEGFAGSSVLGNQFSQGPISLWDHDCDDAMAMLTAFLDSTVQADSSRITSIGRSRGATVAHLMAIRDNRVRRSVILFGATEFRMSDIQYDCYQEVNEGIVATNTLSEKVMAEIIQPWLDDEISLTEARRILNSWSVYNTLRPDLSIQVHHGEVDTYIPLEHANLVNNRMTAWGAGPPEFEFFTYPLAGHNTAGLDGYEERVENYLCHLAGSSLAVVPLVSEAFQLSAWPNPFTRQISLSVQYSTVKKDAPNGASGLELEIRIFDLRGRLIRSLPSASGQPNEVVWDGFDNRGRNVPAGVYLVVPSSPGQKTGAEFGNGGQRILKLR